MNIMSAFLRALDLMRVERLEKKLQRHPQERLKLKQRQLRAATQYRRLLKKLAAGPALVQPKDPGLSAKGE